MTARRSEREAKQAKPRRSLRSYWPNLLRLSGFLLVVYAVGTALVARHVRAEASEMMMGLGGQMMQYASADMQDEPRALYVNGQHIGFGSGHARERSVTEVLDFFEARCRQRDGRFVEAIGDLASATEIGTPDWSLIDGTMRESDETGGYVACFDMGAEAVGPQGLLTRLSSFLDSGDLSDVGGLRYVYARPMSEGGTHFLVFHADDHLNVYEMFPATGDAPGVDVRGVPRPDGTRRLLSAWEEGDSHAVTIYTADGRGPEDLREWYRTEMRAASWEIVEPSDAEFERFTSDWDPRDRDIARESLSIHAEQGQRHVMLLFAEESQSRAGVVTVLSLR